MDINLFFDINKKFKHNQLSKEIPVEFKNWRNDQLLCKKFFNWIREESDTGSLRLLIDAEIKDIVEEISKAQHLAIPHRQQDSVGWRCIVLHGLSSIMTEAPYIYVEQGIVTEGEQEQWTDISKFFPITVNWVKQNLPLSSYSRVRIMILDPGGYIKPHKDYKNSFLGGGLNIALTNPKGVEFATEDNGLIPWQDGDIRMINIGKLHSVRNNGTDPRIHLLAYPKTLEWDIDHMMIVCNSYEKMKEKN